MTKVSKDAVTDAADQRADDIYRIICDFYERHGLMPTIREILAESPGEGTPSGRITSTSVLDWYLHRMEEDGKIELVCKPNGDRVARGIRLPNARLVHMPEEDWRYLREVLKQQISLSPGIVAPGAQAQINRIRQALFGEDGEE